MRFRNRLAAYYYDQLEDYSRDIVPILHKELGVRIPIVGAGLYSIKKFYESAEMRDVLDSITLIYRYLKKKHLEYISSGWGRFVSRVIKEENMGYRLDEEGGIHYYIDEEFEHNKVALIAGLSDPKHSAVLEAFTKSYRFLDLEPPDTTNAVRSIFESIEILYKHIVQAEGKDRLNSYGVQSKVKIIFQDKFSDNSIAVQAGEHMLDSFCDWIDAAHMYRHGQKVSEPAPPPIELAICLISNGANYLRFLLSMA